MDVVRASISQLDSKIKDMKFDIKAFNKYVVLQVEKLTAYGVVCTNLLCILFKAYKAVSDMEMAQQINAFYLQYATGSMLVPGDAVASDSMMMTKWKRHSINDLK
jgi:hypothetical protein